MGTRILLIRFSSLGDVVLATAALEALHQDLPGAQVSVLTKPDFRDLFHPHPAVADTLDWDPSQGLGALARRIQAERYDWVVDLHGNLRTRVLRTLVQRPRWRTYRKDWVRRRLGVLMRSPRLLSTDHVVDRYLDALAPLGVRPVRRLPRVYPTPAQEDLVRQTLKDAGWDGAQRVIALAPGARWQTKAWPPEHWSELLANIEERSLGFPMLLGGPEESELCAAILSSSGARGCVLAGRTSILETAAALRCCSALVTGDSAPLHIAGAVGTPVVALFGPTVRGLGFFPLGPADQILEKPLRCRPCTLHGDDRCPEGHHLCLRGISPSAAFNRLQQIAGASGPSPSHTAAAP